MRALVACIGNIYRGDDAFGVRVAERLMKRPLPPGTRVEDFGIRGLAFAYALLDGWDAVIVVDAAPRGRAPGTLYLLDVRPADLGPEQGGAEFEMHGMDPAKALRWARAMGAKLSKARVVGCEPAEVGTGEDALVELSPAVEAAVGPAAEIVEAELRDLARSEASCTS